MTPYSKSNPVPLIENKLEVRHYSYKSSRVGLASALNIGAIQLSYLTDRTLRKGPSLFWAFVDNHE